MIHAMTSATSDWKGILPLNRILVEGAQELLDKESLQSIFQGPSSTCDLPQALEKRFGIRGGRGMAVRIGRFAFKYVLKYYGQSSGLLERSFRLLPASRRMSEGLNMLSQIFNQHFNEQIEVCEEGSYWLWRMHPKRHLGEAGSMDHVGCYLIVGLLQEFLSWAGGGRFHQVTEQECALTGGEACVFRLEKKPLD